MPDLTAEAEQRYQGAVDRHAAVVRAWVEIGSPLLTSGSQGQLVEHPLIRLARLHEVLLDRLAVPLRQRHRGPDPSGVVTTSIGPSPAASLRLVPRPARRHSSPQEDQQ